PIRLQLEDQLANPRLGESLGVIHGDIDLQGVAVGALETLDDVQLVAMPVPGTIEPSAVVKSGGIDDKLVAFPVANGVPHVGGSQVIGVLLQIGVNVANGVIVFVQNDYFGGCLHDLQRERLQVDTRHA